MSFRHPVASRLSDMNSLLNGLVHLRTGRNREIGMFFGQKLNFPPADRAQLLDRMDRNSQKAFHSHFTQHLS